MKLVKDNDSKIIDPNNVSDKEAEEAIKILLAWMDISPLLSPVAKPTDQTPFLGYSRSTIFFDLLLLEVKFFVNCPKPL